MMRVIRLSSLFLVGFGLAVEVMAQNAPPPPSGKFPYQVLQEQQQQQQIQQMLMQQQQGQLGANSLVFAPQRDYAHSEIRYDRHGCPIDYRNDNKRVTSLEVNGGVQRTRHPK